jgi:glycine C-acetyltransferase
LVSKHDIVGLVEELEFLRRDNLYRKLVTVDVQGATAKVNGKEVILLCSNDYLGLSCNKQVIRALHNSLRKGVSQCSSRLVCGNSSELQDLEDQLARQKRREKALLYPTGYMANLGVISSIACKEDVIVSDELNHASIVDACKMSKAEVRIFKHNNIEDFVKKLSGGRYRRKLVVTEGVFSMDGDCAHLRDLGKIAHENDALLVVDDAHGDFVYGDHFRGTSEFMKAEEYVDAIVSSLSKALGCFGGYVAANSELIDYLINRSRQFIYTSALPSALASAGMAALKICQKGTQQKKLWSNVRKFRKGLMELGLDVRSSSQIIPILIGNEKMASEFSRMLLEEGVFAQAIRYPTVPRGSARIRVSLTSLLEDYIDDALNAFGNAIERLSVHSE